MGEVRSCVYVASLVENLCLWLDQRLREWASCPVGLLRVPHENLTRVTETGIVLGCRIPYPSSRSYRSVALS